MLLIKDNFVIFGEKKMYVKIRVPHPSKRGSFSNQSAAAKHKEIC